MDIGNYGIEFDTDNFHGLGSEHLGTAGYAGKRTYAVRRRVA